LRGPLFRRTAAVALAVLGVLPIACGGGGDSSQAGERPSLTIYSGREEEYVEGLYEDFEAAEDIDLDVRYADSAEFAATLLEEGDASPADVFFSQDAGSLGAVAEGGLLAELDEDSLAPVDDRFKSPDGLWVGTSGRARVAAYNTDNVTEADMPESVTEFTDPEWRRRIGFPPTNSSFQAFVAAMILVEGEEETRSFLEGLAANEPKFYEDNEATTRAVADGEIDVGLVNHYYLYEVAAEEGDIPVANHFFSDGDPGALVNAAGVGIIASSDNQEEARAFVEYVTGEPGQTYFTENLEEYSVVEGYEVNDELVPLEEIDSPNIDLSDLGGTLDPALELMSEVGLL
jgi:iron(III) transport system substrate-binding protein